MLMCSTFLVCLLPQLSLSLSPTSCWHLFYFIRGGGESYDWRDDELLLWMPVLRFVIVMNHVERNVCSDLCLLNHKLTWLQCFVDMNNCKGFKIVHANIRSLLPKIDLFRAWVEDRKPNIITLSETWLTNSISDKEIALQNYVFVQKR